MYKFLNCSSFLDSIAISSDGSSILLGGSSWAKYTTGDNGGTIIGRELVYDGFYYYPGGWAFVQDRNKEIYDYVSSSFSSFISSNYNNYEIPLSYFPAPKELTDGGKLTAVKSLTPDQSFIIYIDHTWPRYNRQNYVYYLGGTNTTEPPTTASTGSVPLDLSGNYQSIEIFKNTNLEFFWVRIDNGANTSSNIQVRANRVTSRKQVISLGGSVKQDSIFSCIILF